MLASHQPGSKLWGTIVKTADFSYILPEGYVAQTPVEPRDHSRLLVLNKNTGAIEHSYFRCLPQFLKKDDLLILNNSRVIPARIFAHSTHGKLVEFLLLRKLQYGIWESIGRPGRKLRYGHKFKITPSNIDVEIVEKRQDGIIKLKLSSEEGIESWGQLPIPPYIHNTVEDPERYQTVYAKSPGSSAAPTAGLHFTHNLLRSLKERGVRTAYITLHIGLDTFQPIHEEDARQHRIHSEFISTDSENILKINEALKHNRRIISIGTTSVRVLEFLANRSQNTPLQIEPYTGDNDLFILPGYEFKAVSGMVTNFHLPKSTLLMMISAFSSKPIIMNAYAEAKQNNYRFFSYGDAMLLC